MINFLNSFLSYLMVMAIIVVVAGVAIAIGITMRKAKNKKANAAEEIPEQESPAEETAEE